MFNTCCRVFTGTAKAYHLPYVPGKLVVVGGCSSRHWKKNFGWLMDADWWNLDRCAKMPYRRPVEPHSYDLRNLCKQMNLVVAPSYEADLTSKDVFGLYCGARRVWNGDTVFTLSPPTLTTAQVMAQMWYVVLSALAAGWASQICGTS